ncbi:MAG: ATP-dependent DNA ligase [Acidimicrobiales bacterium]|nr:ATP-dependent DNA ligase [Acidimicrobiales bacterium]
MPPDTLLAAVVAATDEVVATRARSTKVAALAGLLAQLVGDELPVVVAMLTGTPRQGRIGIGWRTVAAVDVDPADTPTLTVLEVDRALDELAGLRGAGSQKARADLLASVLGRATATEQDLVRRLLVGELRHGALEGLVTDATAKAFGVPLAAVRRAAMLAGDLPRVAVIARDEGASGLAAVGLTLLRPVKPMLAQTAADVTEALALATGVKPGDQPRPASVEWKLDGARIQVHRSGDQVRIYTRNLNDVTDRLPGIVELVASLPATALVLDGEAVGVDEDELPRVFQDTMRAFGQQDGVAGAGLQSRFFDLLHLDGDDLIDEPLTERLAALERVAGPWRIRGVITSDPAEAQALLDEALATGHEGVMVKDAASTYEASRRGGAWRKVKPVHTLDLVVLGVEWGSGRRRGWLSNIHLGARDPGTGELVMVGKTFKGMTDELLAWQTQRFLELETGRDGGVVWARPEQVVEIALDGVQASTRYPGGVALRFARVRRYRDDKSAAEADTIDTVRAMLPAARPAG